MKEEKNWFGEFDAKVPSVHPGWYQKFNIDLSIGLETFTYKVVIDVYKYIFSVILTKSQK